MTRPTRLLPKFRRKAKRGRRGAKAGRERQKHQAQVVRRTTTVRKEDLTWRIDL